MRVLLCQPRWTFKSDVPLVVQMPLGLCYLAAVAREAGHEVRILDALAEGHRERTVAGEFTTYGLSDAEIARQVLAFAPDVVGVSCLFSIQHENAEALCRLIKQIDPSMVTVMGGIHPTVRTEATLACPGVDYVLRGEADFTFTEFLNRLAAGESVHDVDGIAWKDADGLAQVTERQAYIPDLDAIPFPARDLLDLPLYWKAGLAHGFNLRGRRNFNLITSRGCPAPCTFCTISQVWGKKFRGRSPENVVAELVHLRDTYRANHIQFEDDNLTFDVDRAKRLFQQMIQAGTVMAWNTPNGVAAWRMDKACLDLMHQSGCYYVTFAVESANQYVLNKVIKKPQDLAKVVPLIHHARSLGMKVGSFFVVGFPGETRAQIQETFDFPYDVELDWVEYSIATPYWGTKLREEALEQGRMDPERGDEVYSRRGVVNGETWTAEWLEKKVAAENWRYIRHLCRHRPRTFLSQGLAVFGANPKFVLRYVFNLWKTQRKGGGSYDVYIPQHFDWDGR